MANTKAVKTTSDVADIASISASLMASMTPAKPTLPTAPAEKAEATRANWEGTLMFGTLPIAVKTYKATEVEKVELNTIHIVNEAEIEAAKAAGKPVPAPEYSQLKRGTNVSAQTGEEVPSEKILKGYKYGDNQFVVITDAEKKSCMVGSDKYITIESFVPASKVDPIYFEAAEYLAPQTTAEVYKQVFGLLRAVMVDRNVVAIAKSNQKGREQTLIIRPYGTNGMTVHFMYFDNEVRSFNKWTNVTVSDVQIEKAGELVDKMTEPEFDATQYEDGFIRTYKGLINSKINGTAAPVVAIPDAPAADPKMNIMDLLASSLNAITGRKAKGASNAA